jgi:hypothetical protein
MPSFSVQRVLYLNSLDRTGFLIQLILFQLRKSNFEKRLNASGMKNEKRCRP